MPLRKISAEVIFLSKKNKKQKQNNGNDNNKKVIDLTNFISPDMVKYDENGSYTGMTKETYYDDVLEQPVQDADDL